MADVGAYQAYRKQVDSDIAGRIEAHQAAIATVKPMAMTAAAAPLILLADGDSWFDYPLNGILPGQTDVIAQLPGLFATPPHILNLAHYGDATTNLLGVSGRNMIFAQLTDARNGRFDAILFSGGGNDMVGDQFRLWLHDATTAGHDPAKALNQQAFADILGVVETAYLDLINLRNLYAPGIPIFVHAYDLAQPTNNGVCNDLLGPWLYPSLASRGWMTTAKLPQQVALGAGIIADALTQFDLMLERLAQAPVNNVVRVTTLGTVDPATDWANELHPTPKGFQKIALKFQAALQGRFGGRAAAAAVAPAPMLVAAAGDSEGG